MYTDFGQTFSQRMLKPIWQTELFQLFVELFVLLCVPCTQRSGAALMQLEAGWNAFLFVEHLVKCQKELGGDEGGCWLLHFSKVLG